MIVSDGYARGYSDVLFITPTVHFYIDYETTKEYDFWVKYKQNLLNNFIRENTKYKTFADFCDAANWKSKYNLLNTKLVYKIKDFFNHKKMKDLYYTANFKNKFDKFLNESYKEYKAGFKEIIL